MQGGEHQMSGLGCLNRNLSGFSVTDFSDHDDIRVLAQQRAQDAVKIQACPGMNLSLIDPCQRDLDWILDAA
ncbi:hypothetical protein D3C71_2160150 [compost metagenome]